MNNLIGHSWGRYHILKQLGEGDNPCPLQTETGYETASTLKRNAAQAFEETQALKGAIQSLASGLAGRRSGGIFARSDNARKSNSRPLP
ncbi:MAG TPA: hypothetical protein DHW49_05480 [Anaerolineae bacterium]|nr:hypothetical protein [Anaerolineae bacterium]